VNKNDLIGAVAERLETSRKAAEDAVEAVFDTIKEEVAKGERVAISGFGIFEQIQRKARQARIPSDGSIVDVKAKLVPKFKPGASFKDFVNNPVDALKKATDSAKSAPAKTTEAAKKTSAAAKKTTTTAAKKTTTAAKSTATAAKKTTSTAAKKTSTAKKAPAKKAPATKKAPAKKTAAKKATS
jgi:DNA-binding protein HU-beta